MEADPLVQLVAVFLIPVLVFVVTVPLHELFHLLFLRVTKTRGDITIKWFQVPSASGVVGYVRIENEALAGFWENRRKLFYFLLGFSGSAGVAVVLVMLFIVSSMFKIFPPHLADLCFVPIMLIIGYNIIYAAQEGFQHLSSAR